jgi:hypothetical protein
MPMPIANDEEGYSLLKIEGFPMDGWNLRA